MSFLCFLARGGGRDDEIGKRGAGEGAAVVPLTPLPFASSHARAPSPADEPLDKCLARIARSAAPAAKPKKKKGGGGGGAAGAPGSEEAAAAAAPAPPALFASATPIPPDTPNAAAWTAASRLEVGGCAYGVIVNPPTVVKVKKG